MNEETDFSTFIKNRITELRCQKGISEYTLSLAIGRSQGYIQSISSGRILPSMNTFLDICKYFDITPEYSNAIVHAFQGFRAPFSGKIVHIFPEQSAAFN